MNQIFLCRYFEKKINAAIFLLKTERGSFGQFSLQEHAQYREREN